MVTKKSFVVKVTGLSGNTTYHFRGYATNATGTGYTNDQQFLTSPGAPVALRATGITDTGFTANWNAASGGGYIWGYYLTVLDAFNNPVTGYNCLWVEGTSQAVTGLSSGSTYYYYVMADNNTGTGPLTPEVANPGYSSVTNTGAVLGATIASGGGTITASGVVYSTNQNPDIESGIVQSTSPKVTSGSFTVSVTGLSGNTTYYFQGYATNSAGVTGYSGDNSFLTLPDAPVTTAATDVTATGFTANWTAPSGTGTIYGYNLCVYDETNSGAPGYNCMWVSEPATSQAVTGLNPNTTYHYDVNANNNGGVSSFSNPPTYVTTESD
jgi:hypothetical protein